MRVGLTWERKADFPFEDGDPKDADSELLSEFEEDELLSGLRDAGHEVVRIGDGARLVERVGFWRKRVDLVFNLSVGYRGMDRKSYVPGVLELGRIPYVGSGPYALSLTRNKYHSKLVVDAAGLYTSPSALWAGEKDTDRLQNLPYPAIVKPLAESSSIGITQQESIVRSAEAAAAQARKIVIALRQPALVETFVRGKEVEVPLAGWPHLKALGVVGITIAGALVDGDEFLSSDSVYADGYGFLSPISGIDAASIEAAAVRAAEALHIRDYGRIDFRVTEAGVPIFMEASTRPHIQKHSSFYTAAKSRGLSYPEMLDEILSVAESRLKG